jgi:1,4-dihydroxy-2-naphthoate polyprenyltransferase
VISSWIKAFRLRTLPLALSSILLGSFLAFFDGVFHVFILILALFTTASLQILSNLANDYGDYTSGVDNEDRKGPARTLQSGLITKQSMFKMIVFFAGLSFVSGICLLLVSFSWSQLPTILMFLLLGLGAIAAAIKYTMGKKPYGYMGLGDVFVFLFFGLVGVLGVYYLHTGSVSYELILPAGAVGLFSVGVLNLNNMRDVDGDRKSGKRTLVVIIGLERAKLYHYGLISVGLLLASLYIMINYSSPYQLLFLLSFPLMLINIKAVSAIKNPVAFDPHLKKLALSTLFFVLTFGFGLVLSQL